MCSWLYHIFSGQWYSFQRDLNLSTPASTFCADCWTAGVSSPFYLLFRSDLLSFHMGCSTPLLLLLHLYSQSKPGFWQLSPFPLTNLKRGHLPPVLFYTFVGFTPLRGCSTRAAAEACTGYNPCVHIQTWYVLFRILYIFGEKQKSVTKRGKKKKVLYSLWRQKTFSAKLLHAPLSWSTIMLEAERKTKHATFNVVILAASLFFHFFFSIFSTDICNVTEI